VRLNTKSVPLRYHHNISTTILQSPEQSVQRKACPRFIKGKTRRKKRKRVLEVQRVQTLSSILQKGRRAKDETNSPK